MSIDFGPFLFTIDPNAIAATGLWSLGLYLGFSPVAGWMTDQLSNWMSYVDRSLYSSAQEYERTRPAREAQNTFYGSLLSIIPFFILGALCNYGVERGLGQNWAISVALLVCVGCGVYELGRRDGNANRDDSDD
ncbi:hypothetical protein ACN4EG_23230 [Alkalinema pantanalense CENA528]|uniref:hypothetical protein n=1 Tax=Alkalinema pantanalense TaxID=1620705 RepID=UPI003D6F869E